MPKKDRGTDDLSTHRSAGAEVKKRRRDGGGYLVVADETEEFPLALHYAARLALANRGHVGILHVIEMHDLQQWGKVESIMRREARQAAERFVWEAARKVNDLTGQIPVLHICEGRREDMVAGTIDGDDTIRMLILAGSTQSGGPGPLVKHFTGKGIGRLRVPLVIVPGHLDIARLDTVT